MVKILLNRDVQGRVYAVQSVMKALERRGLVRKQTIYTTLYPYEIDRPVTGDWPTTEAFERLDELGLLTAAPPADRLALATPVRILIHGVEGVISAYASADSTCFQVTWFSRHFWAVRHGWVNRSNLQVIGLAASADNRAKPAPAA